MRYRKLDADGDMIFGQAGEFLVDSPAAVAQAIETRLMLWTGEWFLDADAGTDYEGSILGYGAQGTRDAVIKERILGTPGVEQILKYASNNSSARKFTVAALVQTAYGANATATVTVG